MSPARGRGRRLRLERVYPVVGEIRLTTPAYSEAEFRVYAQLLEKLVRTERWDVLRAIKDERLSLEELKAADDRQAIDQLAADPRLYRRLWPWTDEAGIHQPGSVERAIAQMKAGPQTKRRYVVSWNKLAHLTLQGRLVLPADTLVLDLNRVQWSLVRDAWEGSPSDWMHLFRALSHFLTIHFGGKRRGLYHPFRLEVMDQLERKRERKRKPDISPALFRRIVERTPAHVQPAYWALLILGARVNEYLGLTREHLRPHTPAVHLPGAKTEDSEEELLPVARKLWPFILAAVPSPVRYKWLRLYWVRACLAEGVGELVTVPTSAADQRLWTERERTRELGAASGEPHGRRPAPTTKESYRGPRLHDLRHLFGQWLTQAGVAEPVVQAYLRHSDPRTTRRYTLQRLQSEASDVMAEIICA